MGSHRAVLLDRDGVLNKTVVYADGSSHPPQDTDAVELTDGADEALRGLRDAGFVLVGVTNQPDVARGTQTKEGVMKINQYLMSRLPLKDILVCFHDDADRCDCRKPKPGLLLRAAERYNLDLTESFMIGDRWKDIAAGKAAGCRTALLAGFPMNLSEACVEEPDFISNALFAVAGWILRQEKRC